MKKNNLLLTVLISMIWSIQLESQVITEPLPSKWTDARQGFSMSKSDPRGMVNAGIPLNLSRADFSLSIFENGSSRIYIIVTEKVAENLQPELRRFQADLFQSGVSSVIMIFKQGDAQGIRQYLIERYLEPQSLQGTIFIGNLPYVTFEMNENWRASYGYPSYERFPCDLFFMDMDGIWTDSKDEGKVKPDNGLYDTISENLDLEIWMSRIRVDNLFSLGQETDLLRAYLEQNHKMRRRQNKNPKALAYVDDQWELYGDDDRNNLNRIYTPVLVNDPELTTAQDFKNNQLIQPYEFIHVRSHGSAYSHSFEEQRQTRIGTVSADDYWRADPSALFYSFFVCSAANFAMNNYLLGNITFNPDSPALVSWGTTKVGGMWNDRPFYEQLAENKGIGQAFIHWFNQMSLSQPAKAPRWWYGMVLLGDASVHPKPISTLALQNAIDAPAAQDLNITDLDGDDRLDLILYTETGVVVIQENNGEYDIVLTQLPKLSKGVWSDLDLDGDADLAGIDANGQIHVWRNEGKSGEMWHFDPIWQKNSSSRCVDLSWHDVDQNGTPDLFYSLADGENAWVLNKMHSNDGRWQIELYVIEDSQPLSHHQWVDFDADNRVDLIAIQKAPTSSLVLFDGEQISFNHLGNPKNLVANPPPGEFIIYDWSNDGIADFYWPQSYNNSIRIADGSDIKIKSLPIDAERIQFFRVQNTTKMVYLESGRLYTKEFGGNNVTDWGPVTLDQLYMYDLDGDHELEFFGLHESGSGGLMVYESSMPSLLAPDSPNNLQMSWSGRKVRLSWKHSGSEWARPTKFRVRVGKDRKSDILDEVYAFPNHDQSFYSIEIGGSWSRGSYIWSVQAQGEHGEKSIFSSDNEFVITEQPLTQLRVRVFLQGLYENGKMKSQYYRKNLLPLHDNLADRSVVDKDIVDWIRLELRRQPDHPAAFAKDYLLASDGWMIDPHTGQSTLKLNVPEGTYLLSLYHRNHLSIVCKQRVTLSIDSESSIDLTTDPSKLMDPNVAITDNKVNILAGDIDANHRIDRNDINHVIEAIKSGEKGYSANDIDGDGWVTVRDLIIMNNIN